MAHPRMYRDDSPHLAELRVRCLVLPEATEVEWDEVDELLEGSYRQVALERMLRALDEQRPR